MEYLTINNITKICNDNLYRDLSGNFTHFQWYDFQLDFALKNIANNKGEKIDLTPFLVNKLTGYKLTRSQILKLIISKFGTNKLNTIDSIEDRILKKYGLLKPEIKENVYTYDCLGGKNKLVLQNNKVVPVNKLYKFKNDVIKDIDDTLYEKDEKSKIASKIKERLKNKSKKIIVKDKSVLTSKFILKKSKLPDSTRSNLGKQNIKQNPDNICKNLGKFDWNKNSCYSDSILLAIIYEAILNKNSPEPHKNFFYKKIMELKYNEENLPILLECRGQDRKKSVKNINLILDELRKIVILIEKGNIIYIQDFIAHVITKCKSIFSENYNDGRMHDAREFYKNIMDLLDISINDANITEKYYYKLDNYNTFIKNKNFVKKLYGDIPVTKTDAAGNEIYDYYSKKDNLVSDIIEIAVSKDILYSKYKNLAIDTLSYNDIKDNKSNYYKVAQLNNKYIEKKNKKVILGLIRNITYNIEDFLKVRNLQDFTELSEEEKPYKYTSSNIDDIIKNGKRYFFNKEDKLDEAKWKLCSEITAEEGFQIAASLESKTALNNNYYISFYFDRNYPTPYNCKIIPKEHLEINGDIYSISFIILYYELHYVNVFKCNGMYYLYNDSFNNTIQDDYVMLIGDYNSLIRLNYAGNKDFILRNSTFIMYSK